MSKNDNRSLEQKKKEVLSRRQEQKNLAMETATGFGDKKLEGPNNPAT
jgi:hypothetical protein